MEEILIPWLLLEIEFLSQTVVAGHIFVKRILRITYRLVTLNRCTRRSLDREVLKNQQWLRAKDVLYKTRAILQAGGCSFSRAQRHMAHIQKKIESSPSSFRPSDSLVSAIN